MSQHKRCFTKEEAMEIRPYIKYHSNDMNPDLIEALYKCMVDGSVNRTPVVQSIAKNFLLANPNEKLPNCLKL